MIELRNFVGWWDYLFLKIVFIRLDVKILLSYIYLGLIIMLNYNFLG